MCKEYLLKYECDVYEDDYLEGEGEHVNYWCDTYNCSGVLSVEDAIEALFKHRLWYNYNPEHKAVYENTIHYSVMVDNDNAEASVNELTEWKKGNLKLWVNNISITVFCVEPVELPDYN